ncbi:MAG: DUF4390 domain-containing protein [Gammaproteobacteria bacterium]
MTAFNTHSYTRPVLVVLALAMLMFVTASLAEEDEPFVVKRAVFNLDESMLMLDLEFDSHIPDFIAIAIDQGFAVPLMFEIEIRSEKPYWVDDKVVSLKQQYMLHYQPMLDSFVVLDVNTAERHYFDERKAAVQFIELVYNYPMLDINNLAADKNYYARVRFGIDSDELPLPLQSSWFWDSDWDLQSEWYEWEVRRPAS